MKNLHLILFLLLIFLVSCKENINDSIIIDPPVPPIIGNNYNPIVVAINSSVAGIIVSENGQPVEGATITLNNQTQTSDSFGSFRFINETMNKNGTFLKIEKAGYFKSGRRFFPTSAAIHQVRVELIEKNFNQSFPSSTGGTVTFENGGEIIFPQNSIKTADGNLYSGEVKIALKWLDPTASATFDQLPGNLQGVTIQGEEMALETYGMIAVELESTIGESLNIMESQTAQIKMPVPQSLLNNAPDEIPLWSFNYEYGIWAEDGKALLQNGFYVGEVEHFSFWNCDYPRPVVEFSLTLTNIDTQEPVPNTKVKLMIPNAGLTTNGMTNTEGEVSGKVPLGVLLELEIINICDEVIHSETVGPYVVDTDLSLAINIGSSIIVSGDLLDCNIEEVTDGLLIVNVDGNYWNILIDSNPFEVRIPTCQSTTEISVSGGSFIDYEQGDFITFPVADSVSVGDLVACGNNFLQGHGLITLDSTTTKVVNLMVNSYTSTVLLEIPGSTNILTIHWPNNGIGDYSTTHYNEQFIIPDLNIYTAQEFEFFEVLEYGENIGDLVSGKMSGYFLNTNGVLVHLQIDFTAVQD